MAGPDEVKRDCLFVALLLVWLAALIGSCRSDPPLVPQEKEPPTARVSGDYLIFGHGNLPFLLEMAAATAEPEAYTVLMRQLVADGTVPAAERNRRWQACHKARQTYWRGRR